MSKRFKVCALIGDFDDRKKGMYHYVFPHIDGEYFDIAYICYPARDFELWTDLYNTSFDHFGLRTYLIPRYQLLRRVKAIKSIFQAEKPDLIFSASAGYEPYLLKKITGIPLVDSFHGVPQSYDLKSWLGFKNWGSFKLRSWSDFIIAVSQAVKTGLMREGIKEEQIRVIYNGVDVEQIQQRALEEVEEAELFRGKPVILSVGRLSPEKGHRYLLEAFSLIKDKTDALLLVIGWGPEENQLRELLRTHSLENRVYLLGFKENPFKYMQRSALLVLPSLSEAFPSVLLETAACGLPVVATDCGGPREALDILKHGVLVPPQAVKELAAAMLNLLDNREQLENFSLQARANINQLSIEKTAQAYQKLWRECLTGA